MTLDELMNAEPELVGQITASAKEEARAEAESRMQEATSEAVHAERERIREISEIANTVGDPEMVKEAMYGENACTASELALRAMQKQARLGEQFLSNRSKGIENSGVQNVPVSPNEGNETSDIKTEMSIAEAAKLIAGKE